MGRNGTSKMRSQLHHSIQHFKIPSARRKQYHTWSILPERYS
jgi:hypothetical protein